MTPEGHPDVKVEKEQPEIVYSLRFPGDIGYGRCPEHPGGTWKPLNRHFLPPESQYLENDK